VATNRDLLVASLLHPEFLSGTAGTGFYRDHPPTSLLIGSGLDVSVAAVVAAMADVAHDRGPLLPGLRSGFRSIPVGYRQRSYAVGDREVPVRYRFGRDGVSFDGPDGVSVVSASASRVVLNLAGVRRSFDVARFDDRVVVDGAAGSVELRALPRFVDPTSQGPAGALVAPMPGTVVRVAVTVGSTVTAGQPLLWLEAMKMEHAIHAPVAGIVAELPVAVGQQVSQGTPLAVVDG
jgi:propionyl-CoA carboxylase alpha chain